MSGIPALIIDPGHGGKDNGGGSNNLFTEKEMNLKISLYQYNRFRNLGVPVFITRKEDIYLSPSVRTKIVRDSNAKYCISNHINAASNSMAKGVETIYSIYSDSVLANKLLDATSQFGLQKRRAFSRESNIYPGKDYYYMHRDTGKVVTTIIEYGFATNKEDSTLIEKNWSKLAEGVVKIYCQFVGYKYTAPNEDAIDDEIPILKEKVKLVCCDKEIVSYITTENKAMVEVRPLCDLLGYSVVWDDKNKTVIIKKSGN